MTTTLNTKALPHIAGSAFALTLTTETPPVSVADEESPDLTEWGTELILAGRDHKVTISGVWISAVTPWSISFTEANSTPWPVGDYEARLAYVAPGDDGRRFIHPLGLVIEVTR